MVKDTTMDSTLKNRHRYWQEGLEYKRANCGRESRASELAQVEEGLQDLLLRAVPLVLVHGHTRRVFGVKRFGVIFMNILGGCSDWDVAVPFHGHIDRVDASVLYTGLDFESINGTQVQVIVLLSEAFRVGRRRVIGRMDRLGGIDQLCT